jgi:hypothetical protein
MNAGRLVRKTLGISVVLASLRRTDSERMEWFFSSLIAMLAGR